MEEITNLVKNGDLLKIRTLININKAIILSKDCFGQTVLHWVVKRNKYELIPLI